MESRKAVSLRPFFQAVLTLCCLFIAALFVAACSSSVTGNVGSGMGTVTTFVSDPATCAMPNGSFKSVWVAIVDVQANISSSAGDNDGGWVDLTPGLKAGAPKQVNLLGIANDKCFLASLGDSQQLQAGTYQQIRVILASDSTSITSNNCGNGAANCVELSDGFHTLNLSSEAQTGIKIPASQISGGGLTVAPGKTVDLDINFLTCQSIVKQGNGQFRLKPVLHAGEVSTTAVSMNGKVVDANGPVDGAMVSLEQKDSTGTDRVVDSAATGADGTWVICPVVGGDPTKPYDVVITGVSSTGVLYAPSIVTGVSVGDTVGTVTLSPPPQALATSALSSATLTGQVSSNSPIIIDVIASALETVNGTNYTIPLPIISGQSSATLTLETAAQTNQNPACAANTYCENYQMVLPSTGAYIGAWAAVGPSLTQPAPLATYVVDGTTTSTCTTSTSELMSTPVALSGTGPFAANVSTLAFAGCS